MAFHRLATPTYFGGLPVGYDKINDPADPSVGGTGVPALVMGKKSGGPNDGTYFVAFGEDAQSRHANRAAQALAENTDALDDVQRTSIPTITFVDATAAGAVTSIALVGEIFVGNNGTTNNQANRNKIVRITDQNDNDLEVSGSKIVVTLMHDGASNNVVGTQATGFRTNATLTVAPPIPNTTTYRVWFGTRNTYSNIALTDKSGLFRESMRTVQNISGEVRALFRQIHAETSVGQTFDAAFDSTIRSLAASGLNERYRRARLQPVGFVTGDFDVPGGGAVILRDGQAVTIKADEFLLTGASWADGSHAMLKLVPESDRSQNGNAASGNSAGDIGIWHEVEWKAQANAGDSGMFWRNNSAGPVLMEVIPYDMRATTFNGDDLLTYVDSTTATATINPDSGSGTTARQTVQCGAGQHFALGTPTRTVIRTGIDLLEVTDSSNRVRTFVITEVLSSTRVRVVLPTNQSPLFSTTAEPGCKIRLIQTMIRIGGALGRDGGGPNAFMARPIIAIPPAILTDTVANETVAPCSFFGAQTGSVVDAAAAARRARALEWGSTGNPDSGGTVDGSLTARGWINGDGSLFTTLMRATAAAVSANLTVGGDATVTGSITAGDASIADNVIVGNDLTVGGDVAVGGDVTCDDLGVGDAATVGRLQILEPTFYTYVNEDFLHVVDDGTSRIYTAHGSWTRQTLSGTPTYTETPGSAKNPGVFRIQLPAGATNDSASVFQGGAGALTFTGFEQVDIIAAVDESVSNTTTRYEIGFADGTDDDALTVLYTTAGGWDLHHRVSGSNGAHNGASLGSFTDNSFAHFRFLRVPGNDIEVYRDGSLMLTVLAAQLPLGNCSPRINASKQSGDTGVVNCYTDAFKYRLVPGSTRTGPL